MNGNRSVVHWTLAGAEVVVNLDIIAVHTVRIINHVVGDEERKQ